LNNTLYIFFLLFLLCFCCETKSQTNIVPDGSFEDTTNCPYLGITINGSSPNWFTSSNYGTADHFCVCSNKDSLIFGVPTVGVPNNLMGSQYASNQNCYAGFFAHLGFGYKEYLGIKLTHSLKSTAKYNISFKISLADSCIYAVKHLGVLFTQSIFIQNNFGIPNLTPQIKFTSINYYTDKSSWMLLEDTNYIASGNECFMTIGSFDTLSIDTTTLQFPHTFIPGIGNEYRSAYYYIDDVKIIEKTKPFLIPNVFTPNNDAINDIWTVNCSDVSSLTIFNRWGLKIKEDKNILLTWDGSTTSGEICSNGIYYYIIETKEKMYNGFIHLIR